MVTLAQKIAREMAIEEPEEHEEFKKCILSIDPHAVISYEEDIIRVDCSDKSYIVFIGDADPPGYYH